MDLEARSKIARQRLALGEAAAFEEMRRIAIAGHLPSQVFVGWMYEVGQGVEADRQEAQRWYAMGAESGDAVAQHYLGRLLVRSNEASEGVRWLRLAAQQGYAPAMYWLGRHYADGLGVDRNDSEAVAYIEAAARAGHVLAQRWMAKRGLRGRAGLAGFWDGIKWFFRLPVTAFKAEWENQADRNLRYP